MTGQFAIENWVKAVRSLLRFATVEEQTGSGRFRRPGVIGLPALSLRSVFPRLVFRMVKRWIFFLSSNKYLFAFGCGNPIPFGHFP